MSGFRAVPPPLSSEVTTVNRRFIAPIVVFATGLSLAGALCVPAKAAAPKKQWPNQQPEKEQPPAMKEKPTREKSSSKEKDKSKEDAAAAEAKPRVYFFKGQKKASLGGAQAMVLQLEDPFNKHVDSLFVPNNDPEKKEYDPQTDVADFVKDLEPGTAVEVQTEKVKGRILVKSVGKADIKPGEDMPNGFIFIDQKMEKTRSGDMVVVTLSKFGREEKFGVPMVKSKDATGMAPDPKIDYVITKLGGGAVVEATVRKGNPPMITEIYEYKKPEQGKFIGLAETKYHGMPAQGFEITATDGTKIAITFESTEQTKNKEKTYVANPQQLKLVRSIKPDTDVEVRYRVDGTTWVLRDIKPLNAAGASADAKKSGKSSKTAKSDDSDMKDKDMKKDGDDAAGGKAAKKDAPTTKEEKS
jgi:hypothetical protein